jgi:hypothetical protein
MEFVAMGAFGAMVTLFAIVPSLIKKSKGS